MKDKIVELENGLRQVTTYSGSLLRTFVRETYTVDKDDRKQGHYESYRDNRQLHVKCNYKNDKLDGQYLEYNEKGELIKSRIYKEGELVEDKLNQERVSINYFLESIGDKYVEPTPNRKKVKKITVEEYRKTHPKNGGR